MVGSRFSGMIPKQQAPDSSPALSSTHSAAASRCRWSVRRGPAAVGAIFAAFRRAPGPRAEIGAGVLRERRAKINRVIDAAQNERIDDSGSVKMTAVSVK
jgi:hypothetical protein